MRPEQTVEFCDAYYANPKRSGAAWDGLRAWCARRVLEADTVIELGCGAGELAEMLPGTAEYLGVDQSSVAVDIATRRTGRAFITARLPDVDLQRAQPFTAAIACEVLEHIHADLDVLRALRCGVRVICTVPSADSPGHVRVFRDINQIVARYSPVLMFTELVELWLSSRKHFGFVAVRRDA